VEPYAKRIHRVPKKAIKVNVILIFDTNQSFHVRLAFRFFEYEIRNRTIYNTYFLTLEEYLHENETSLSLQCSYEMLCTPCPRNPLTSVRLSASAASGLDDNFSLGTLKNNFAALIYKQLLTCSVSNVRYF
jgi:hypothetical protein